MRQLHQVAKVVGRLLGASLLATGIVAALTSCNDGSTGCCMVCVGSCACGDSCQACSERCTQPKGCACTSNPTLKGADVQRADEALMSLEPDAGR